MSKIVIPITDLVEDVEFTDVYDAFKNAGHEVTTINFNSGSVTGKHGTKINIDKSIDDVSPEDFDALFIPGGFSPDQLRADKRFIDFTQYFIEKNKLVMAICHGPQLLIQTGLTLGRRMTAYVTVQRDLYYAGAYVEDKPVVVDRNLITSREPKDIPEFNQTILKHLK